MDFLEVLEKRRSVRRFLEKGVEEEKLQKILEAANSAPSAGDLQAYRIIVVKNNEKKRELARAALGQWFIAEAPLVLVFCSIAEESSLRYGGRGTLYSLQDATIAASYSQLAATDLGLASVWVGAFSEGKVRKVLGIKEGLRAIALIPVGYAGEKPNKTPRKEIGEISETIE